MFRDLESLGLVESFDPPSVFTARRRVARLLRTTALAYGFGTDFDDSGQMGPPFWADDAASTPLRRILAEFSFQPPTPHDW